MFGKEKRVSRKRGRICDAFTAEVLNEYGPFLDEIEPGSGFRAVRKYISRQQLSAKEADIIKTLRKMGYFCKDYFNVEKLTQEGLEHLYRIVKIADVIHRDLKTDAEPDKNMLSFCQEAEKLMKSLVIYQRSIA
jgi:hypothetical protein